MPIKFSDKRERILDFLQNHNIGVLATVDPNGDPNAAAIYFTVDASLDISFLTKVGTKKHDNLQRHSHAMLVAYEAMSQTTVQIKGIASEVTDTSEAHQIFADVLKIAMDTGASGIPPIDKLELGKHVMYRIKPKEIHMATFIRAKSGAYDTIFETLNP